MKNIIFNNNNFTCYLAGHKSEEIFNDLKNDKNLIKIRLENANLFQVNHKRIFFPLTIIYKLTSVKIKFIDTKGNTYKGVIYFINDLKNVLKDLNFTNPFYKENNKYFPLYEIRYPLIFINNIKEIKNIIKNPYFPDENLFKEVFTLAKANNEESKKKV